LNPVAVTIVTVASDKHSIRRTRNIGYKTFTNNVFMLILLNFMIRRFSSLLFLKKDIRVRLRLQNQPCRSCGITIGCVVLRLRNNAGVPVPVSASTECSQSVSKDQKVS
jgi:hypothetical protein